MNQKPNDTKSNNESDFLPLAGYHEYTHEEMIERAREFHESIRKRRTVRHFSDRDVPREVIESCLAAAGTSPSGANLQPWHFVVVSDQEIKDQISRAVEKEERLFYTQRAPKEWLNALEPLGTSTEKPFLRNAPYLIVIFQQKYGLLPDGSKLKLYYSRESVGIATGILITAIHHAGLVSLVHTPSPMGFLNEILGRPENENPFLLLVVGYPEEDAVVPDIQRKPLKEITTFL